MGNNCCGSRKDKPEDNLMEECKVVPGIGPAGDPTFLPKSAVNSGVNSDVPEDPIFVKSLSFTPTTENISKTDDVVDDTKPTLLKPLKKALGNLDLNFKALDPNRLTFPKAINGKVYIKILVDCLEIAYLRLEDFGCVIRPIVELKYENEKVSTFLSLVENDESGKNLNVSLSLGNSILNTSQNMTTLPKAEFGKVKVFNFKQTKIIVIPKEFYFSDLTFWIKNELNAVTNIIDQEIQQNPPEVIFGSARIPVNILVKTAKNKKNSPIDGQLEIRHRNCQLFGVLKIQITASEKAFTDQVDTPLKNKKLLLNMEDTVDNQCDLVNFSEYGDLDYTDLNPLTYQSLAAGLNESAKENVKNIPKFISLLNSPVNEDNILYTQVNDAIQMKNALAVYQILMLFSCLVAKDSFTVIDSVFKKYKDQQSQFIADQIMKNLDMSNPYVASYFLRFCVSYYKYQKDHKNIAFRNAKVFTDENLCMIAQEVLVLMFNQTKRTDFPIEWKYKIRESIIWCLNIFFELASDSEPVDSKNSNTEIFTQRKKDYTTTYFNCSRIISDREQIFLLHEIFLQDSEIMNLIYRIFRKGIVTLTQYQSKLLAHSLTANRKEIAVELKVYLIEDNLTLSLIKLILNLYQQYPELQMNLLQLLFNITNLDVATYSSTLVTAAKSLGLQLFKDGYDIFRGRLSGSYKNITILHLGVLANLSEIVKANPLEQTHYVILNLICNDIKSLYSTMPEYKKKYEEFIYRKKCNIEIQDLITRIGVNLTKIPNNVEELLNSFFFNDMIEYLLIIGSNTGPKPQDNQNQNPPQKDKDNKDISITSELNQQIPDFIQQVKLHKGKRSNVEDISKSVTTIVENILHIFINTISLDLTTFTMISEKLAEYQFKEAENLFSLIEECVLLLEKYKIDVTRLSEVFKDLRDLFE